MGSFEVPVILIGQILIGAHPGILDSRHKFLLMLCMEGKSKPFDGSNLNFLRKCVSINGML